MKFVGDADKAYACVSPAIIYDENSNYTWKQIKKPTVLHKPAKIPKKRKSAP